MYILVVRDNMDDMDKPHELERSFDFDVLQQKAWRYEEQADNFERYSVMSFENYLEDISEEYYNWEEGDYQKYKSFYESGLDCFEDFPSKESYRKRNKPKGEYQ